MRWNLEMKVLMKLLEIEQLKWLEHTSWTDEENKIKLFLEVNQEDHEEGQGWCVSLVLRDWNRTRRRLYKWEGLCLDRGSLYPDAGRQKK